MANKPIPEKKSTQIIVRVTPAEHRALSVKAAQSGTTISDVVRKGVGIAKS